MTDTNTKLNWDGTYPTLVIIRGLPGSGKTFLAAELHKILGASQAVVLDPDAVDFQSQAYRRHTAALTAENVDVRLHLYRFLREQAYQAIDDRRILIWNQPFTNLDIFKKMLDRLHERAAEAGSQLSVLLVEVETDPDVANARIKLRIEAGGHGPSDNTFERFVRDYHSFEDQGYATIKVEGESDVLVSAMAVMEALDSLWLERQSVRT